MNPLTNTKPKETYLQRATLLQNIYPWLVWFLGATFFFYKYLLQVSPSVMSTDLMRTFNVTGAGLGNLAACFFYAYLIMQIPVGLILDRWSPRLITTFAIFVSALGALLFAKSNTLIFAGVSRAMIGFGAAFAAVSCFKLTTLWFTPRRFALVAGLSMTAAMLGAVGGEAPLSLMVHAYGWRSAMVHIAIIGFVLMILVFLFVRDRAPSIELSRAKSVKVEISLLSQLGIILKEKQTWLLSLYSGLAFAPISVFGGLWGVSFLKQSSQLSATAAASAVSMIFVGFAIGCPIAGWYSDFIGKRKTIMLWGTIIATVAILGVLYLPIHSVKILNILLLCFGLGASCFFLCFSMIREIHPLIFAATVLGFMNTFDSIWEAFSEPFIGKLLDMGWNGAMDNGARIFSLHDYHLALSVLPIYFFIALLLLFFIKETHCQQKLD